MKKTSEKNWSSFWKANKESRFTKKSWSKIRIIELLDEILEKDMYVLDAGCGSGFFSNYFISKGCNVYSLDYSEEALDIAKGNTGNNSKEYVCGNLLENSLAEKYVNKFDIIFSDGLFEHFSNEEQERIMKNFMTMKKENGIIATFVPNRYSWWQIIRPFFMPGIAEKPFTLKKLEELHYNLNTIKKGGLNVIPFHLSPDKLLGSKIGMIIYLLAK